MRDRHADLADLALGPRVVAVVAGLGRQIESDRKAGLALRQILPVKRVGFRRGRMARVGSEYPRFVALGIRHRPVAPDQPVWGLHCCNATFWESPKNA